MQAEPTALPTTTPESYLIRPDPLECPSYYSPSYFGQASLEELVLIEEVLERVQPGATSLDEVADLLGEPTYDRNDGLPSYWLYEYSSDIREEERWDISVFYEDGETVTSLEFDEAISLGQMVDIFGDPSIVYRYWCGEEGTLPCTLMLFEERSVAALFWGALCPGDYPAEFIVDRLFVEQPETNLKYQFRILEHLYPDEQVELEWTGVIREPAHCWYTTIPVGDDCIITSQ
jgi:hypothetical protein